MILSIFTYGMRELRVKTRAVDSDSEELQALIDNMIETMRNASGVGLAAPQVGRSERLFVVDLSEASKGEANDDQENVAESSAAESGSTPLGPMVFLNPELELLESDRVELEEGCLSIPELREDVTRPDMIRIRFLDRHFEAHDLEVSGLLARVIQHECDHLEGILFVDHLSPMKRLLLQRRLRDMAKGDVSADYPIVTPTDKKWQASGSIS